MRSGGKGSIRFVPARGEAGAMNMADAYARVSRSLGVVITSTGTAAGNAAGSQVEALTAGSPVLHITTQVDREFMDRDRAAIHDVPRQPDMLKAVSKHYVRAWEPVGAIDALIEAAAAALTPPTGPVTFEIPVDVQRLKIVRRKVAGLPRNHAAHARSVPARCARGHGAPGQAANAVAWRRRPRRCGSRHRIGRTRLRRRDQHQRPRRGAGGHAYSLGAFNMTREAEEIYAKSDLMIVIGSRLRGNETQNNKMKLPRLVQIDADPLQAGPQLSGGPVHSRRRTACP